jgi:hypothetical protein
VPRPRPRGPLRAFYQRVKARCGMQIAVVATARKLTVLFWHLVVKGEDYAFARPSLTAKKYRKLELRAGLPPRRGRKGSAAAYSRRRSGAGRTSSRPRLRPPTAIWSPTGSPTNPKPHPSAVTRRSPRSPPARWAWPPSPGRDYRGPPRARLRGRADSPTPCTSPRGRPRPPLPTLLRSSPGSRSFRPSKALHLDPGCGPEHHAAIRPCPNNDPTTPGRLTLSSVVRSASGCATPCPR